MQKEYSSYGLYFRADKKIIKYSIGKTPTRYENTKSPKGSWFLDLHTTKWGKKVPERNRPGSTHTDRRMQNSIFFLILSPSLSLCYSYCSYYDSTMIVSTIYYDSILCIYYIQQRRYVYCRCMMYARNVCSNVICQQHIIYSCLVRVQ